MESEPTPAADLCVDLTGVYSLSMTAVDKDLSRSTDERERLKAEYSAAALRWLAKAEAGGFFKTGESVKQFADDADVASLRSNPEFQKIIADLSAKLPSDGK